MKCYDFDWQINEFMVYCRSTQLRERTMYSYEQTLRLFERWLCDELKIYSVDKVTENMIRKYINDLQERGKYTFFVNDLSKVKNYPERRRDFRKPVSVTTINNYIRNLRVFFNWLERDYVIKKNPMRKIRQLKNNRKAKVFLTDEDLKKLLSKFDKSYFTEHRNFSKPSLRNKRARQDAACLAFNLIEHAYRTSKPAWATAESSATEPPDTPIPPICFPSFTMGKPPPKYTNLPA